MPPAGWHYAWGNNKVDYGMDRNVVNDPRFRQMLVDGLKSLPVFSLVMDLEDADSSARFLIGDHDGKFPALFDAVRADADIRPPSAASEYRG